jgi:fructokinase
MTLFGSIEAGGTKFNCIVASGPDDIRAETRISTTTPAETLGQVVDFFQSFCSSSKEKLAAVGIACFGPLDLDLTSPTYGFITTTPKPGWAMIDVAAFIQRTLQAPVAIDTDVNAAAVGEGVWGAAQGLSDFIYFTIGTGIGGGPVSHGKPIHGLIHPEMGHIRMPHDWIADPYQGYCSYHGDCFEGLASGPAIKERWGQSAETLPLSHPGWDLEAQYIAQAMQTFICALSPQRIILGGGVMQQGHLFPIIHRKVLSYLKGYLQSSSIIDHIDSYIVPPGLGNRAGVLGGLALAQLMTS